jgi:exosortase
MSNHEEHLDHQARPLTPALLVAIVIAGFGPLLAQFFFNLWKFDTYQFFPLALAGAGALAWRGLKEVERPLEPGLAWITFPLVLLLIPLLGAAALLWSPWMGTAAFLVAILAFAWWLGGWKMFKAVFPAWIMLLTVVPPPLKLDTRFALLLQEWATAGSSRILAILGIPHFLTGLIIEIPGQRLLVEEACSGINSVLFMTSACVFYAMWQRRSLFFLGVLYILTIAFVLFGNLIRITSGAWVLFHFQIDLFEGWKHEALGLILTAAYLGFIVTADALLAHVTTMHGMRRRAAKVPANNQSSLLEGCYFEGGLKFVTVALVILGAAQLLRGWDFHFRKEQGRKINPAWMDGSAKFTMPSEIDGWRLVGDGKPVPKRAAFEDGVYSHIWQYQKAGMTATISLDYPFYGYHDVTVCYRNAGWTIDGTKLQRASVENAHIPCMEVEMMREGGLRADLFYSTVDESGVWLEEPGTRSPYDAEGNPLMEGNLVSRLTHRLRLLPYANSSYDDAINYRIQLIAAARGGLGTAQRREVEKFFKQTRLMLAEQFVSPSSSPTPTPTPAFVFEDGPSPVGTPDPTKKAITEAVQETGAISGGEPDATKRAVLEAIKEAEERAKDEKSEKAQKQQ